MNKEEYSAYFRQPPSEELDQILNTYLTRVLEEHLTLPRPNTPIIPHENND